MLTSPGDRIGAKKKGGNGFLNHFRPWLIIHWSRI